MKPVRSAKESVLLTRRPPHSSQLRSGKNPTSDVPQRERMPVLSRWPLLLIPIFWPGADTFSIISRPVCARALTRRSQTVTVAATSFRMARPVAQRFISELVGSSEYGASQCFGTAPISQGCHNVVWFQREPTADIVRFAPKFLFQSNSRPPLYWLWSMRRMTYCIRIRVVRRGSIATSHRCQPIGLEDYYPQGCFKAAGGSASRLRILHKLLTTGRTPFR